MERDAARHARGAAASAGVVLLLAATLLACRPPPAAPTAQRLRPVIDRFLARATAGSPVWSQRARHADRVVGFLRAQLCLWGRLPGCAAALLFPDLL